MKTKLLKKLRKGFIIDENLSGFKNNPELKYSLTFSINHGSFGERKVIPIVKYFKSMEEVNNEIIIRNGNRVK